MKIVVGFMFYKITDELVVNDGIKFVCFFVTFFVIKFISYTTICLGRNSIHYYLLLVFKFDV